MRLASSTHNCRLVPAEAQGSSRPAACRRIRQGTAPACGGRRDRGDGPGGLMRCRRWRRSPPLFWLLVVGLVVIATASFGIATRLGVGPIGRWVLREAGRLGHGSGGGRPPPLAIAVNLSARQLQHPGIVDEMAAALDAADLDPHSLVLEITETAVMEQLDAAITILTELRQLGVRLALDDFGTGYSSLSYCSVSGRHPQDRPRLRQRRRRQRRGLRLGPGDRHPRPDPWPGDRRRRDGRAAGRPA